jgi:hypothetical protein
LLPVDVMRAAYMVCVLAGCGFDPGGVLHGGGGGGEDAALAVDAASTVDAGAPLPDGIGSIGFDAGCAPPEPPGGECPEACTGGCSDDGTCTISCEEAQACEERPIRCPAGWACHVICTGVDACDGSSVQCPEIYACTVSCDGADACGDLPVQCGDGPCSLECESDVACDGATVDCGASACCAL